jgi:enoyl-[acyl-carrier protein] reductase II
MKKKTRLCELLGIEYPIIQGGMTLISGAELAAAVSNAGGLGVIVYNVARRDPEALRAEIQRCKSLTDRPFGVNYSVDEDGIVELMQVAVEEGVKVVTTSAGNPLYYTAFLKEAGIKVMHLVGTVRHAARAEEAGVDAVIAEGFEAGGHNSPDEITTMALIPQVRDAVQVPVVAAGGIADARGFVAALALGADGVQVGTRFIATEECRAHPAFKEAVVGANDVATVVTGRSWRGPSRVLSNDMTQAVLGMEAAGTSVEDIGAFLGRGRGVIGQLEGDMAEGEAFCGEVAGLVNKIVPAGQVVQEMVEGARLVLEKVDLF